MLSAPAPSSDRVFGCDRPKLPMAIASGDAGELRGEPGGSASLIEFEPFSAQHGVTPRVIVEPHGGLPCRKSCASRTWNPARRATTCGRPCTSRDGP